jgi:hypothetical protein
MGKVNNIVMDRCTKSGMVFEDVIAASELVNCSSVQMQCTGSVTSLNIDKCDGVQVTSTCAARCSSSSNRVHWNSCKYSNLFLKDAADLLHQCCILQESCSVTALLYHCCSVVSWQLYCNCIVAAW